MRRERAWPSRGDLPQPLNSTDSSPETWEAVPLRLVGRLRNPRRALSPVTSHPRDLFLEPEISLGVVVQAIDPVTPWFSPGLASL